jgi:hypothetical protein
MKAELGRGLAVARLAHGVAHRPRLPGHAPEHAGAEGDLGFDRIVVSEIEAPNMLAIPVFSHLVMAFVYGPVDSTDARARNIFRSRARLPGVGRAAGQPTCMCGRGVPPTRTHSVTCGGPGTVRQRMANILLQKGSADYNWALRGLATS